MVSGCIVRTVPAWARLGALAWIVAVAPTARTDARGSEGTRGREITITDLGLLPGGTSSSGLAINNEPVVVGLANDRAFNLVRPFWSAATLAVIGFAEDAPPAGAAVPEHMNDLREMAGTNAVSDNVYMGVYWSPRGEAFVLPPMAGVDPFYGSTHTRAHGINALGQLVGSGKEGEPDFLTHAVFWPDHETDAIDLGFLGEGVPLNYSEAYAINDLTHVVGNSNVGTLVRGFLWRDRRMVELEALPGQVVSEAFAINNTGLIAGKSNFFPVTWSYDVENPASAPTISPLPIPAGFFSATPTAVNEDGDVVGYAGSPSIDAHAILWRGGIAIDLGVWPGGHYSVASDINEAGQVVGTGTVAGDNLDHALLWTTARDPAAVGDCNGDGRVDGADLGLLLGAWGSADETTDLNGDGAVDGADLGVLLGAWTG